MTSKEALERLGAEKLARGELIRNDSKVEPYIECINKDLERLEALENENKEYFEIITKQAYLLNNKHIDRPFIEILQQENEKLKKAIEILKKYYKFKLFPPAMDNIPEISISTDWEHYISKQEFELLKEVLGE